MNKDRKATCKDGQTTQNMREEQFCVKTVD